MLDRKHGSRHPLDRLADLMNSSDRIDAVARLGMFGTPVLMIVLELGNLASLVDGPDK